MLISGAARQEGLPGWRGEQEGLLGATLCRGDEDSGAALDGGVARGPTDLVFDFGIKQQGTRWDRVTLTFVGVLMGPHKLTKFCEVTWHMKVKWIRSTNYVTTQADGSCPLPHKTPRFLLWSWRRIWEGLKPQYHVGLLLEPKAALERTALAWEHDDDASRRVPEPRPCGGTLSNSARFPSTMTRRSIALTSEKN
jgi:hypothetical protein